MDPTLNSVLLAITGSGDPDEYGNTPPGENLWTGRVGAYLKRLDRNRRSDGMEIDAHMDLLYIRVPPVSLNALLNAGPDWSTTTLLVRDQRGAVPVTRRFNVTAVEFRAVGSPVDSLRMELSEASDGN